MPAKKWPPPEFPLVEGDHALTAEWSIRLPNPFARRLDEGSLVLWRPGLTVRLTAWNNDRGASQADRLALFMVSASSERFAEQVGIADNVTRFSYRLSERNEKSSVESLYAQVINERGHLQMAVYFDDPADEATARQLVDSVVERHRAGGPVDH